MDKPNYIPAAFWGLDFGRAILERPFWARILFRIAVGKYAYREFIGLGDEWQNNLPGPGFGFDYGIEGCEYHKDQMPSVTQWEKRWEQCLKS